MYGIADGVDDGTEKMSLPVLMLLLQPVLVLFSLLTLLVLAAVLKVEEEVGDMADESPKCK